MTDMNDRRDEPTMKTVLKYVTLPEPWASMTEEQAHAMTEADARKMFGAVQSPVLTTYRSTARTMQTSELIATLSRPERMLRTLFTDEQRDQMTRDDHELLCGAALLILGDEIDRRVPRP